MNTEQLIGVINVKSHYVKFSVVGNITGNVLLESSKPIDLIKPCQGWIEVDAENIWITLCATIDEVIEQLKLKNVLKNDIKVIGIINEGETILAWDSISNKPLCNAIHYTDTRADTIIQDLKSTNPNVFHDIENSNGSKVTSMSCGIKLKWIIDNTNNIKPLIIAKTIRFGTLDTWLVWKLTKGNLYVTDVTNASRTLLMDLKTLEWSLKSCRVFNIQTSSLPTIQSSSKQYGIIKETGLNDIIIGSIFVNHQATLYGLNFTKIGQIMSNYDNSCTVSCIVGTELMKSNNGLITTVAYKIDNEPAIYALEGQTLIGGKVVEWLKTNIKILNSEEEIGLLNIDSSDVYFVPAFNGLGAPHWKPDARGIICGITHFTNKKHLVRAALESICFHTKDVCAAFEKDTGITISQLIVDGPYSIYDNLLNYQADILGVNVTRSRTPNMAILGSAKAAARVLNMEFKNHYLSSYVSKPTTTEVKRKQRYLKWLKAVRCSIGLSRQSQVKQQSKKYDMAKLIHTAYLMAMMAIIVMSNKY